MLIEILQTYNPYKTKPRNPPILKILIQTKKRVSVRARKEIEDLLHPHLLQIIPIIRI